MPKSKLFYDTLDASPVFKGTVAKEDRSKMNAVFVMEDPESEKEFLSLCEKEWNDRCKRSQNNRWFQGFHVQCIAI